MISDPSAALSLYCDISLQSFWVFCLIFLLCLQKCSFAIAQKSKTEEKRLLVYMFNLAFQWCSINYSSGHNVCAASHILTTYWRLHREALLLKNINPICFHISFPSSYLASKQPKTAQASADMRHMVTSNSDLPQTGIGQLFVDRLSFRPSIR